MLGEQINDAINLMDTVFKIKDKEAAKKYTAQTNNTFFSAFDIFSACMESYLRLKDAGLWTKDGINSDKEFTQLCNDIKTAFKQGKVSRVDSINRTVTKLNSDLHDQWKAMYESATQKTIDDLKIMEQVSDQRMQLRTMRSGIENLQNWPVTEDALLKYKKAIDQSAQFLKNVKFDQDIETFLKKVSEKSATLSDLTPSIITWLQNENLTDRISLTIK